MAFIEIPNCIMVEMIYEYHGERVENVFHNSMLPGYDVSDIQGVLDIYKAWWIAELQAGQPSVQSLVELIGTDQASATGPRVQDSSGLPAVGAYGGASQPLPGNVTVAVTWTTNQRGRSYRGRTYHIGLLDGAIDGNNLGSAQLTALTSAYSALLGSLAANSTPMAVASRYTNNAPRATGIATIITDLTINPALDSQRRRLAGRGR